MRRLTFALAAALVAASACKPQPPVPALKSPDGTVREPPPPPSQTEEQEARAMAQQAAAASSESMFDQLVEKYPGTEAAAEVYERRAKAAAAEGRVEEAVANYEKLLFFRPTFPRINQVREEYARLLLQVGRHRDAAAMLKALYAAGEPTQDQIRLGILLVDALRGAGQGGEALRMIIDLRAQAAATPQQRSELERIAMHTVDSSLPFKDAAELWNDVGDDAAWAFLHPSLAFKLAKVYFHTRQYAESEKMLQVVTTRFASSEYSGPAQEFLTKLRARFVVNPKAVGVVLPMSGRFQQFGERALKAIEMQLGKGSGFTLVVKDSKGEALDAAKAVEELVLEHNVIAIIGDMFSKPAMAAAQKAEELSTPMLSLSHSDGLPELGPWIFRVALTVEAQARGLADVAFNQLGMTRFALLYPRNPYGVDFATAFWREVEKRKGEIRGAQSYDIDQTTFKEPVSKLVGRYYKSARHEYHKEVAELRAKNLPAHRFQAALEKVEKGLTPVVDFDAIVIPDVGKNIGLIAPALAYEDITLTHDPKLLERIKKATGQKDLKPITLIGGSTWNAPQTVESCERYCEDAVFVDAYFADSPDAKVRDFVSAFKERAGVDPMLPDAQAFDAAGLLKHVLAASRSADREALRKALGALTGYPGVTGTTKFDDVGDTDKSPLVLTIKEQVIQLLNAPVPQG